MKRPFATLCIFLFIGILGSYFLQYSVPIHYILLITSISLIVFLFYEKVFIFFLVILIMFLGSYLYGQGIVGDILAGVEFHNATINAKILKEGSYKRGFNEYEVGILNLYFDTSKETIKINKNAQLKMYLSSTGESDFTVNDVIEIKHSKVTRLLKSIYDENENSYELFLKSKGIEYILEVDSENVQINKDTKNTYISPIFLSYKAKVYLEDFLDSTLDFENSDILKSIIFGNQGYLSKDRLSIFSKTGTAHIMAVSGLHVGLIVMIVDKFFKAMSIGKNNRKYLTVAVLIFYSYMVYFPVSILRAGIMYTLYAISYFLHRRYDPINAVFFIAFILLIYRPMTIFSISFQLSFMATLSILIFNPILDNILSKKIGYLSSLLSVTLAAQIGTMPIMAYHFNQISIISLFTNILIIPLLAPMLSIAFISMLFGTISFRLGFLINQITNQLLNYINWICTKCAIIPYGSIEVEELPIIYIFAYYLFIAAMYIYSIRKEKIYSKKEGFAKKYEL